MKNRKTYFKNSVLIVALFFSTVLTVNAAETYKLPPRGVIDILEASPPPRALLSPDGRYLLLAEYESMPSIDYMAQPLLRIAGLRILPSNNSARQTTFFTGLHILDLQGNSEQDILLPENAKMGMPRWSNDNKWLAFLLYKQDKVELWGLRIGETKARKLSALPINSTLSQGFRWLPDNKHLLLTVVDGQRGKAPVEPLVPVGPVVQQSSGEAAKVRTYQDLLKNPFDETLFKYYCTSQLVRLDMEKGNTEKLGEPGIFLMPEPSGDGKYLLVQKIKKPFSYIVPYYRFTRTIEVWNLNGEIVHRFAKRKLAEAVPLHGVITGARSVSWRPLKAAELVWVEALDGGDPHKEVAHRDRLMSLQAPFKSVPVEITRIQNRFRGIDWLEDGRRSIVYDYDWKRRWIKIYLLNNFESGTTAKVLFDLNRNDRYAYPGDLLIQRNSRGEWIAKTEGDWIFLKGDGASPIGDLPFLNRFNVKTRQTETLFRSAEGSYETFTGFVQGGETKILTRFETKTEPPNYYLSDLKTKNRRRITNYQDPAPQLTGLKKNRIQYTRADGVPLSGTLYLPPNYKEGQRLPLVIWAYPREYRNAKIAGQIRGSSNRFTFFRGTSRLFFVTQGYAVLDGAQMPVVGDPETMNDTFVEQIVTSAKAAIDKLDKMGIIDPNRVGVAGHSYGAFMTANLLAHSNLFAAGIARSGAYNRTLTPFGFQSERRTLWEAPDIYFNVSPFMHADKIHTPILLIHGEADNNSGTFPLQSKRFFAALKGHGATARLVMLPHESHGYRARESVLHVLAEMFNWFDKYVKNRSVQAK